MLRLTLRHRLRLRPRVLIDVSSRSTKCNVLGLDLDLPVAIAPTALQKMAHSEGERATARGVCMCRSRALCACQQIFNSFIRSISCSILSRREYQYNLHDEHALDQFHRRGCNGSTKRKEMVSIVHLQRSGHHRIAGASCREGWI